MNRTLLTGALGSLALLTGLAVLAVLAFTPLQTETGPGVAPSNQVPSDLEAMTIHDRLAIQLRWTDANRGTATYILQRSEGGGGESWQDLVEFERGTSTYLDGEGLKDGVTYLYRIRAFDPNGGSGYSNGTSAIATALPTPP